MCLYVVGTHTCGHVCVCACMCMRVVVLFHSIHAVIYTLQYQCVFIYSMADGQFVTDS